MSGEAMKEHPTVLRWRSSSVMIFMTFFSYYFLQESIEKVTIPLNRSWEELLSAKISQLSNTYKPN